MHSKGYKRAHPTQSAMLTPSASLYIMSYQFVDFLEVDDRVNALLFCADGKFLITGGQVISIHSSFDLLIWIGAGDDECVTIWSMERLAAVQQIAPVDVGPITVLAWLGNTNVRASSTSLSVLCVGTARGAVIFLPFSDGHTVSGGVCTFSRLV